jgi:hypothetical protein
MLYIKNTTKFNQIKLEEILEPIKWNYEISWIEHAGLTTPWNSSFFKKICFVNKKTLNLEICKLLNSKLLTPCIPIRSGFDYKKHEKTILKNWKIYNYYLYDNPDNLPLTMLYGA